MPWYSVLLIIVTNSQIKYVADKGKDNWNFPDEILRCGQGDCEDFAILKFHYIRPYISECYVLVVHRLDHGDNHAVLYVNGRILDNIYDTPTPLKEFLQTHTIYYAISDKGVFTTVVEGV